MLVDNFHVQNITSWGNTQVMEMDEMLKKTGEEEWTVDYYWSFKKILEEHGSTRDTKARSWGNVLSYTYISKCQRWRNKKETEVCSYSATKLISLAEL